MIGTSQKEAWQKVRDGWAQLLAESGGSYSVLVERGAPREYVREWQKKVEGWKDGGVPWKFLVNPAAVPALMLSYGLKERWELAAIDDLNPTSLDLLANELQNVQNAVLKKQGKPETAERITAPASEDPFVKTAQTVYDTAKAVPGVEVVAPVNPKEGPLWKLGEAAQTGLTWATPQTLLVAGLVVGGVVLLGPAIGSSLGAYTAARARK